jgi:cytochrome c oxidase subunit 2
MSRFFKTTIQLLSLAALLTGPQSLSGKEDASDNPRVIHVRAEMFKFSPGKINLRKGETVKLSITSKDIKHGFRIKGLGINVPIEPGGSTEVLLTPSETGRLIAGCSVFCGLGHKRMELKINVRP